MREILFRGKEARQGKWIEGFFCPCVISGFPATPCIIDKGRMDGGMWEPAKIVPETVGQFTGLLDANGEKIFEGDILQERNGEEIGFIQYYDEDGMFYLVVVNVLCDFSTLNSKWYEVIGNIHDNPELVEVAR